MVMQPPPVTKSVITKAQAIVSKKKSLMASAKLRFEELTDGSCAQTLHLAPSPEKGRLSSGFISLYDLREAS